MAFYPNDVTPTTPIEIKIFWYTRNFLILPVATAIGMIGSAVALGVLVAIGHLSYIRFFNFLME